MHRSAPRVSVPGRQLIDKLLLPGAYDHPVNAPELIETHISWVILAGDYAYKIKKPLMLGFLDFRDLERRRFFCDEEIRLNRPSAPDIYVDVVPITDGDTPRFGGDGEPIEFAVRMQRFEPELRLDVQLENGQLGPGDMKELGRVIALRHESARRVPLARRDHQLTITREFMWENFHWLEGIIDAELLTFLKDWTGRELDATGAMLGRRFDDGFVRECHGDLHLANIVRMPGGIRTFDCIEFNADLRNSDIICDIAFLVMDLIARDRHDLAARFLNRYLEQTGDYSGVALLDLYFVYRCLVRAKVAAISRQECQDTDARDSWLKQATEYCAMAAHQATKARPVLVVMHGFSGSGKTWLSEALMGALPAIRIRSDTERRRHFDLDEVESSESAWGAGIYSADADASIYSQLCEHAQTLLAAGHNVILDAAFLRKSQRVAAAHAASRAACPAVIVDVRAPRSVLRDRAIARATAGTDASEAGDEVIGHQLAASEPIGAGEPVPLIACDNVGSVDVATIVHAIKTQQRAGEQVANGTYD